MSTRFNFCFALAIITLLGSCKSDRYKREVEQVDEIQGRLDSAINIWDEDRISPLRQRVDSMSGRLEAVENTLVEGDDTLSLSDYQWLERWAQLRSIEQSLDVSVQALKNDMKKCSSQLSDLRHDLDHNLLDRSKAENYLKREANLCQQVLNRGQRIDSLLSASYILYDQVDYFVDSLENNISPEQNVN